MTILIDNPNGTCAVATCNAPLHTKQFRVLHCVLSLDCGGLEQLVVQLSRGSLARGDRVEVLCLEKPGMLAHDLQQSGVTVYCINKTKGLHFNKTRRGIRELLSSMQPDVIHTHQIGVLFHVGMAVRKLGIPIIHSEHGKHYESSIRRRWLGRIAARFTRCFVCVSSDIAKSVLKWRIAPAKRLRVIDNGIDIEQFSTAVDRDIVRSELKIPGGTFIIGTVGRLADVKRQDVLIRAFAGLSSRNRNVHLIIVGEGPRRESLQCLISSLNIADRVHMVGYRSDRARFLKAMDIFALTSESEGMPLVVLEAWASGLAVICSHVGGLTKMIRSGENGLLFPTGDHLELSNQFAELIANEQLRNRIAMNGNSEVRAAYSVDKMTGQYHDLYREVSTMQT